MKKSLMNIWLRFAGTRVGRSIFRVGLPRSNLSRAQAMVSSFFLHLHPAKVHRRSLKFTTTLGLGLISLYLFLILTFTGVLLMFFYVPHPEEAYANMKDLEFVVSAGSLLRNMHRWAAHLMVVTVFLHMFRVFYTGSYKTPREFNWVVGVSLLLLTLGLSFTGYLLPWDQLAFWAITVGTNIAGYAPLMGDRIPFILLGGNAVASSSLLRFYVLHVMIFPGIMLFMLAIHLWRVRKDGGLARPDETTVTVQEIEEASLPGNKSYGLMGMARGSTPAVGINPEDEVLAWPNLLFREIILFMGTLIVVLLMAVFWNAPLEEIANPIHGTSSGCRNWWLIRPCSGA
jgi:quinol-cytochrome oxidoreductase complex cytochrome b subunit